MATPNFTPTPSFTPSFTPQISPKLTPANQLTPAATPGYPTPYPSTPFSSTPFGAGTPGPDYCGENGQIDLLQHFEFLPSIKEILQFIELGGKDDKKTRNPILEKDLEKMARDFNFFSNIRYFAF